MHLWMAMRQALTAMDVVMRESARAVGLDAAEVLVVLLLGQTPSSPACDVAFKTGRSRQQVQRSLMALQRRRLVHPGKLPSGRVAAWALTAEGQQVRARLEVRLTAYEEILRGRADLPEVASTLVRMAEAMVNRPSSRGWRWGLLVPHESRLDPRWDRDPVDETALWEPLHQPLLPSEFEEGAREGAGVAEHVIIDDESPATPPSA